MNTYQTIKIWLKTIVLTDLIRAITRESRSELIHRLVEPEAARLGVGDREAEK